jgi:hypothetical protein
LNLNANSFIIQVFAVDVRIGQWLPIDYGRLLNIARNMRFVIYVIKMKLGMNATIFWNANFLTVFD